MSGTTWKLVSASLFTMIEEWLFEWPQPSCLIKTSLVIFSFFVFWHHFCSFFSRDKIVKIIGDSEMLKPDHLAPTTSPPVKLWTCAAATLMI